MVRSAVERDEVELPFIVQLKAMGWEHVRGSDLAPDERVYPGDVLLTKRLTAALRHVNRLPGTGDPWMKQSEAEQAVDDMRRAARSVAAQSLLRANGDATALLLRGIRMDGPGNKDFLVQYVDWEWEGLEDDEILARNQFLVVDQFRVRKADGKDAVLDLVLFVNGIPVAVVECKSPERKDAIGDAIRDLRMYAGQPLDTDGRAAAQIRSGVPELFAPAQLLIAASGVTAALGTISSAEEHYAVWRSVEPDYPDEGALRAELEAGRILRGDAKLTGQHKLIATVLKPRNLLNVIRHYVFELPVKTKEGEPPLTVKAVCRHQQYRAVEKIVRKLRTARKRGEAGAEDDERGGVIWHTQGSGKSLTMSFLARRLHMSRDRELNRFTLLVVTDRKQLQRQLSAAVQVSGSPIRIAKSQTDVEGMLRRAGKPGGRAVIFAMIQKYLGRVPGFVGETDGDDRDFGEELRQAKDRIAAGEDPQEVTDPTPDEATTEAVRRRFTECSTDPHVLVLVDEAHRSHTSVLHACLRDAVPNAARIGFTGTPIMKGKLTDTGRIFGLEPGNTFLDSYRMTEAEKDKVVVPVRYEGRTGPAEIRGKEGMNEIFEDLIASAPEEHQDKARKGTKPTSRDVAESFPMIRAKAADMLAHYVRGPLTGGFKAQIAAVSRRAAVYYRAALRDVRADLLARVRDEFDPEELRGKKPEEYTQDELLLLRAWQYQEVLRRMDFVPVISEGDERKSGAWREWTDAKFQEEHIERFLEPFPELPPDNPWVIAHPVETDPLPGGTVGLNPWSDGSLEAPAEKPPIAFLIVKSMLLTGFDAPIEQALYLDRPIQDAELLQAVARVNRPARLKREGHVVDYYGVLDNLGVTLAAYRGDPPVLAGVRSLSSEVPAMHGAATHLRRFLKQLGTGGLDGPGRMARAMLALHDPLERAEYDRLLGEFLDAMERVLPHEAALELVPYARRWAQLQQRVRRHYRDEADGTFSMRGYGRKVRALIAEHLTLPEITQAIAPVSILDPDFDEIVGRVPSVRESAAEQVQALRYHLQERLEADERPVYRTLSEDLQKVLDEFEGRWEDIKRELGPLIERARQAEQADPAVSDLTSMERRMYAKLSDQLTAHPAFDVPDQDVLRTLAVGLSDLISAHVSRASWAEQETSLDDLQVHIWNFLKKERLRAKEGGLQQLTIVSNSLAGFAQQHAAAFRSEGRGQ
ncbi:type I restriction endonuclease [Streptomyces sp. NBC_00291]|uniref:type I restriction endonuclease subunit R n=1 Tax=Streptomyces sp. NBC_00291 TaxID=2975704 RepID=UPI00225BECAF|nr:type I restriction endonuclease [Streptomyces sp. NBC_00291]MCX5154647.1 type I restriction endonuclease [Streptomyces sp. NBC_00291]